MWREETDDEGKANRLAKRKNGVAVFGIQFNISDTEI